jgi:hypothetical protein
MNRAVWLRTTHGSGAAMMSFDLMRAGWPNMVVVAALAVLPLVSLALTAAAPARATLVQSVEPDAAVMVAAIPVEID